MKNLNINDRIAIRENDGLAFIAGHITSIDGDTATTDINILNADVTFDINSGAITVPRVFREATASLADENTDAELAESDFNATLRNIERDSKEIHDDTERILGHLKDGHLTLDRDREIIRESLLRRAKALAALAERL